mmetsp:Transcript_7911/g.20625  ORF Transcript_7911/g.20625 Transcript_7911/m.20625 type:complete len:275 (+) Transcript_7911:1444-2268(+)
MQKLVAGQKELLRIITLYRRVFHFQRGSHQHPAQLVYLFIAQVGDGGVGHARALALLSCEHLPLFLQIVQLFTKSVSFALHTLTRYFSIFHARDDLVRAGRAAQLQQFVVRSLRVGGNSSFFQHGAAANRHCILLLLYLRAPHEQPPLLLYLWVLQQLLSLPVALVQVLSKFAQVVHLFLLLLQFKLSLLLLLLALLSHCFQLPLFLLLCLPEVSKGDDRIFQLDVLLPFYPLQVFHKRLQLAIFLFEAVAKEAQHLCVVYRFIHLRLHAIELV